MGSITLYGSETLRKNKQEISRGHSKAAMQKDRKNKLDRQDINEEWMRKDILRRIDRETACYTTSRRGKVIGRRHKLGERQWSLKDEVGNEEQNLQIESKATRQNT